MYFFIHVSTYRSGIAGLQGVPVFSFDRHFEKALHGCIPLCANTPELLLLHIFFCQHLPMSGYSAVIAHLLGVEWHLVLVLTHIFLMANDVE